MSREDLDSTARSIREDIRSQLPQLLCEDIKEILNNILPNAINDILMKTLDKVKNGPVVQHPPFLLNTTLSNTSNCIVDLEVQRFTRENRDYMNYMLHKREDIYFKLTRCEHLTKLYHEYILESQPYVPKKFCKNNYHLMSLEKYNQLRDVELQRFRSEN